MIRKQALTCQPGTYAGHARRPNDNDDNCAKDKLGFTGACSGHRRRPSEKGIDDEF
jgi:hypothetical protein